uniref:Myosin tail domain-containing protein n=1 Tax=Anopheles farauti TaxID=69004 RepID=A0A182Q8S2_9DIPT
MSQSAPRRHPPPPSGNVEVSSMSANFVDTEWEARESQRQRELEEARARAAQMEKTMKWWSDCTANWREKWSKVRTERNKARDEAKQLRSNLEAAIKESNSYKREKCELEMQITQLKKEMEKVHTLMMKHAGRFNKASLDAADEPDRDGRGDNNCSPDISSDGLKNVNSEDGLVTKLPNLPDDGSTTGGAAGIAANGADLDIEEYILQGGAMPKHSVEFKDKSEQMAEERRLIQQLSKDDYDEDYLLQKISMLQLRLDDAQKTIQLEREEKAAVHRNLEKVRLDMQEMRDKCEELRAAKQDAVRELLTLQEQHRVEMRITHNSLQEEIGARETLERRLCELRTELERLQAENAAEWGKRERLETEKLNMERESKKLRAECQDLQERLERKGRPLVNSDVELRSLQQELLDKNKELSDIRHSHSKMKKMLSEANTELGHAVRRAEQYETEVKRLRSRVEELKHELAAAEDELDAACNHVRRLQRTNEELSGQTEGLQVQIQHLQTSGSPKQQQQHEVSNYKATNRTNYTANVSYKPNINDLKQLFDNSAARGGGGAQPKAGLPVRDPQQPSSLVSGGAHPQPPSYIPLASGSYYDAKPSYIDHDAPSPPSLNNNKYEFERAKQKFDNITRAAAAASSGGSSGGHKTRPSGGSGASSKQHNAQAGASAIPKRNPTTGGAPSAYYEPNVFPGNGGGRGGAGTHQHPPGCDDMPPTKSQSHINETIQLFDVSPGSYDQSPVGPAPPPARIVAAAHKPINIGKMNDVNLDGLKVSEDDEVSTQPFVR